MSRAHSPVHSRVHGSSSEISISESNFPSSRGTFWRLHLEQQPPQYPFVDTFFPVKLSIIDEHNDIIHLPNDTYIPVNLQLLCAPTLTPLPEIVTFSFDHPTKNGNHTIMMGGDGQSEVGVKVSELSSLHGNHFFSICARVDQEKMKFPLQYKTDNVVNEAVDRIEKVVSNEFKIVSHRLRIVNELPGLWFKDKGGRENCISARVVLESPRKQAKKSGFENVPLEVSLVYDDNFEKVFDPKGGVLTVHPDSITEINSENQEAVIKFRIEDVSKNHQSKGFCLLVEPKLSSQHGDISPAISNPVQVKSKPNLKRKPGKPNRNSYTSSASVASSDASFTKERKVSVGPRRAEREPPRRSHLGTTGNVDSFKDAFVFGDPNVSNNSPKISSNPRPAPNQNSNLARNSLKYESPQMTIASVNKEAATSLDNNQITFQPQDLAMAALLQMNASSSVPQNNSHLASIAEWTDALKNQLCELHRISQLKQQVETKVWNMLAAYPDVVTSFKNASPASKSNDHVSDVSINNKGLSNKNKNGLLPGLSTNSNISSLVSYNLLEKLDSTTLAQMLQSSPSISNMGMGGTAIGDFLRLNSASGNNMTLGNSRSNSLASGTSSNLFAGISSELFVNNNNGNKQSNKSISIMLEGLKKFSNLQPGDSGSTERSLRPLSSRENSLSEVLAQGKQGQPAVSSSESFFANVNNSIPKGNRERTDSMTGKLMTQLLQEYESQK